ENLNLATDGTRIRNTRHIHMQSGLYDRGGICCSRVRENAGFRQERPHSHECGYSRSAPSAAVEWMRNFSRTAMRCSMVVRISLNCVSSEAARSDLPSERARGSQVSRVVDQAALGRR